jgi:hypothetical protein
MKLFEFLLAYAIILFFISCESSQTNRQKENLIVDDRLSYYFKLMQKVECIGCNPTKEELLEYSTWKNSWQAYNKNHSGQISKIYPKRDYIFCNPGDKSWYCNQPNRPPPSFRTPYPKGTIYIPR